MSRLARLPLLLFVCSFAPAVMAQSADVSIALTLPPSAVYHEGGDTTATAEGTVTVTNSGTVAAQGVIVDLDPVLAIDPYYHPLPGFTCAKTTDHYRCTAASMAPGAASVDVVANWTGQLPAGTVKTTTVTVSTVSPADPNPSNNSASANTVITWSADLELESIDSFFAITPGAYCWVGVGVVDYGPSPATDFKLTFTIPPGATFSAIDTDLGVELPKCTTPAVGQSGDVVCTLQEWRAEEGHASIYVEVQVAPSTPPGTLTFNGTITSSDALKSPQSASGTIQVVAPADLSVAMTSPSTVNQGDSYDNVVVVTNNGPGTALNAAAGVSFSTAVTAKTPIAPAGWTCSNSSHAATCTIASFPPGTATFTFPGLVTFPTQVTSTTQTAGASAPNDVNRGNNTSVTTTAIQGVPPTDVSVAISGDPNVVHTGDLQTYTVQITNTGSSPAVFVALNAQLPGTLTTSSCSSNANLCSFPAIDPGATATASFTVRIDAAAGNLTASATVTASNVSGQRTADTTTTDAGVPDVDVAPILTPPAFVAAAPGVSDYVIGIVNHGPDTVHGWSLAFTIEGNATVLYAGSSDPSVQCQATGAQSVQCSGTDLGSSPLSGWVEVVVPWNVTQPPLHATLTASTVNHDVHPENDVVTADTPVLIPGPDLVVTMTPATSTVNEGTAENFNIHVTNIGTDAAFATLFVPLAPSFVLAAPSPCTGGDATQVVCSFGVMNAGADRNIDLMLLPTQVGTLTATAQVSSTSTETRTDNNTATVTVNVVSTAPPPADVAITVGAAPATLQVGDAVTYTITATNAASAAAAAAVTVHFSLPSSVSFVSASPGCSGTSAITCTAGTLDSGSSAVFEVTARAVEAGSITATATVSTTSPEVNTGNNSGTATIIVNAPPPAPSRRRAARH